MLLDLIPALDLFAVVWFLVAVTAYDFITTRPAIYRHSISAAVQVHRTNWMVRMSERDNRIVDGQLLGWLVNANAFFASTSVIVIGGLTALLGYGDKARLIFESLPQATHSGAALWQVKVIFLMTIMVYAFFKFAWAFRLSHYTVSMLGATPPHDFPDADARVSHARRTAALLGLVGAHVNEGLRAFYYLAAGLLWFYHPLAFVLATTWIILILLRRDFFSHSRAILKDTKD